MAQLKRDSQDAEEEDRLIFTARWVCSEAGLGMAVGYLLQACWRQFIPWLPEDLRPTAMPPDFRMHYGRLAKRLFLQELEALLEVQKSGMLHAEAFLCLSDSDDDALLPSRMHTWFSHRGL